MAIFIKAGRSIIGVQFNKKEQEAVDKEIRKQILNASRQNEIDLDCSILWMLHTYFGFGKKRLKKAWKLFYQQNQEYEKFYEFDKGDGVWVCRRNLKDLGCDVEQWYKEDGLL